MPSHRGWAVTVTSAASIAVGRIFGIRELFELGLFGLLLVATALLTVRSRQHILEVHRFVQQKRIFPGRTFRVWLSIHNKGKRTVRSLELDERVPRPAGNAKHRVPRMRPGERTRVAYEATAQRRGFFRLGPGRITESDPFGLAQRVHARMESARLIVYPLIENLRMDPLSLVLTLGGSRSMLPAPHGEEFFTIREHQPGDDMRRIHWRSTARLGKVMIRQEEPHRRPHITIVVDDVSSRHLKHPDGEESFERVLSSAASIVEFVASHRSLTRLVFCSGTSAGREDFGDNPQHYESLLEGLALASPKKADARLLPLGGVSILITTRFDHPVFGQLERPPSIIVLHPLHTFEVLDDVRRKARDSDLHTQISAASRSGMKVVVVPKGRRLAEAWDLQTRFTAGRPA